MEIHRATTARFIFSEGVGTSGDTLYRQRIHITQRNSRFTFTTTQMPEKAGIDPFALLIDRIPNDNVKTVILESPKI